VCPSGEVPFSKWSLAPPGGARLGRVPLRWSDEANLGVRALLVHFHCRASLATRHLEFDVRRSVAVTTYNTRHPLPWLAPHRTFSLVRDSASACGAVQERGMGARPSLGAPSFGGGAARCDWRCAASPSVRGGAQHSRRGKVSDWSIAYQVKQSHHKGGPAGQRLPRRRAGRSLRPES